MQVLVTDGEQRSTLALVRSLGRHGHDIHVSSSSGRCLAGASRYCRSYHRVSDALLNPQVFVGDLLEVVQRQSVEVLIPVTEASLLAVLSARGRFGNVVIPFPDLATFQRISDKADVLTVAQRLGIPVPKQLVVHGMVTSERLSNQIRFPVVAKPARSVGQLGSGARKLGVGHAADLRELQEFLGTLPQYGFPVLLQERIVGQGIGVFLLIWEGKCIGEFLHRRIREKPPAGGVSVYRESVPTSRDLVDRSLALLREFAWQGVAMVEYKLDASSGTPYLMEINGRFWGSLQLAIDSGVNFPVLLLQAALGGRPQPVRHYRTGVRSRWWWGDVDHLLAMMRKSRAALALPREAPGRLRTLRDVLTPWRPGDRSEVLRLSDPLPFLRETVDWLLRR